MLNIRRHQHILNWFKALGCCSVPFKTQQATFHVLGPLGLVRMAFLIKLKCNYNILRLHSPDKPLQTSFPTSPPRFHTHQTFDQPAKIHSGCKSMAINNIPSAWHFLWAEVSIGLFVYVPFFFTSHNKLSLETKPWMLLFRWGNAGALKTLWV